MNYADFINGISFRFWQPHREPWGFYHPRYKPVDGIPPWKRRLDLALEIANTRLPANSRDMRERLRELCEIPRMSTYAIAAMINAAVAQMRDDECFVNVGVWNGFTLLSGMAGNADKKCIGVDNFSEFGGPRDAFLARFKRLGSARHQFHDMDYEEYFAKVHRGPIGFYIYDGEHSYQNQLKGLELAEPFFSDDCIILVDDTNLKPPRHALFDFMARSRNRYKLLLDRRTRANLHPTLWNGVVVLQKTR